MDDLIAFLRARLDEDERAARALDDAGDWSGLCGRDEYFGARADDNAYSAAADQFTASRVLAEVDAKRRIIDWCVEVISRRNLSSYGQFGALKDDPEALAVTLAVETLRLEGLPFVGHPDYRAEWRP